MKQAFASVALASAAVLGASCEAAPSATTAAASSKPSAAETRGSQVTNEANRTALNQQFRTLDDYLAHLERQSHVDGKWYKQIKPGLYELQTGNLHLDTPSGHKSLYTREELERKFGFRE